MFLPLRLRPGNRHRTNYATPLRLLCASTTTLFLKGNLYLPKEGQALFDTESVDYAENEQICRPSNEHVSRRHACARRE